MKRFAPLQISVLIILSATVIVLAILAFANGKSVAPSVVDVSITPMTTSKIVEKYPAEPTPSPTPIPTPMQEGTPQPTTSVSPSNQEGDAFFTLDILGSKISVAYGVEEATLKQSPGWLTTSALPGEEGMCVVYGHRNRNHLKALEKVEYGDTLTTSMPGGESYRYTVCGITIYESTDDLRLPTLDGKTLVLATCYPFRYSGNAPGKYVVVAIAS